MAASPNWIDNLWENPHDSQAENELRKLWLRFQADRKQAWDQLRCMVACSEKLKRAAAAQISGALPYSEADEVEQLAADALDEAEAMIKRLKDKFPATTPGVFVPYLRQKNAEGRHHWVQEVLSRHFEALARPGEREQQLGQECEE